MAFDSSFFWHYLLEPSSVYLHGLWLTLSLSVISQSLGTLIGVSGALGSQSRFRIVRLLVRLYTWINSRYAAPGANHFYLHRACCGQCVSDLKT